MLVFAGSKALGLEVLRACLELGDDVVSAAALYDDRDDERSVLGELQATCDAAGVEHHLVAREAELAAVLEAHQPEVCLVAGWYRLIGPATLAIPRRATLGLHASLLPRYRGGSPIVWAMVNGEAETGISLFTLEPGLDDGDVWDQRRVAIGPEDTIAEVLGEVQAAAVAITRETLPGILDGTVEPRPQDHAAATFGALRTPADGLVDFGWSAGRLHDFVRAQTRPYPGAWCRHGADELHLHRVRPATQPHFGTPGQIVRVDEEGYPVVACGDGEGLHVLEVEVDGSALVDAADVSRVVRPRLAGREAGRSAS